MNKSLRKELRREIRNSKNRFLSIFVMVALGVLFLVGLRSAAPDMRATSDRYFDEANFYDVQILSTLGLTEGDIAAFSQVEGVETAEGGWSIDVFAGQGETQKAVKAISLDEVMNHPTVTSGRLPTAAGECAVEERVLTALGLCVGDTVTLTPGEDMDEALKTQQFTITGTADSPLYIALDRGTSTLGDGTVYGFVLLAKDSFDLEYFTQCSIIAQGAADMDAYGADYEALVETLTERLETAAEARGDLRYQTLLEDAQGQIDDAKSQLEAAEAEAQEELSKGQKELGDARTELDDGWAALEAGKGDYLAGQEEGQQALDDARRELDDGWAELEDAKDTLNAAQRQLDSQKAAAEEELLAAETALGENQKILEETAAQLAAAREQLDVLREQTAAYAMALAAQEAETAESADLSEEAPAPLYDHQTLAAMEAALGAGEAEYAAGISQLTQGQTQLDAARREFETKKAAAQGQLAAAQGEIDSGWGTYFDGRETLYKGEDDYAQAKADYEEALLEGAAELADSEQTLLDGEEEYAQGLTELETARTDAEAAIAAGREEIAEAEAQLGEISLPKTYVLDRDSNYGFVSYDQNATRMENLAQMFPLIFFIVAALVCLTTMTRMVEEERTQIGSIKAMGYGTGAIAAKFLLYGAIAALGGSVVGAVIGTTLIPWVIFTSYGIMYNLPNLIIQIHWGLCGAAAAAGLLCTMGATVWAMFSTARLSPAELMRPKTPKAGKRILLERITPIWKHLRFSVKVSARNLFRYKKRLWMTVIGVAGCTALLIAGLGLRSSIFRIIDLQFGEIYQYNVDVTLDDGAEGIVDTVTSLLGQEENVRETAVVSTRSVSFQSDSATIDGSLTVTDQPEALYTQINFRGMNGEGHMDIPEDGVLIDEKLSELLDVSVGDTITIDCGQMITVTVGGVVEHYVYHFAYMTEEYYQGLTGEEFSPNRVLLTTHDTGDEAVSQLCGTLMALDGVQSAENLVASAHSFRGTMEAVNAAVMIIIISAAALALVVLYNLTNINITERIRELATIKVLGFYDTEVAMYIYRENIVLTIMGIGLGQLLGKWLCTYLVRTIEMDIVMFGRQALPQNYVLSVILSLLFAVIVNFLMFFRMRKIDMVQSLKSVE